MAAFSFWILLITGTVLFILLDTSVQGAWKSIAGLATVPLGLGDLLRGLHRYSADVFMLATAAHLLREWLAGHAGGVRRFAWLTGVPLLGFVFVTGVGGFWLNWDQLGQYSAVATAEWIDRLPMLLSSPLSRNFLPGAQVSDRLFSLFVFVHLGVPLLMLYGLWFHVQRLTRAALWPPRRMAVALLVSLSALSLVWPVRSHDAAALDRVPELLRLDWILLFVHPLVDATSAGFVWLLVLAGAVALFGLPFLPAQRAVVAQVDPANCNGCQRCFVDCPYAAVTMVPHPNQRVGRLLAVVDADLCAACGICAGACPSSTPFRSTQRLVTGIDMPQSPVDDLRQRLRRDLHACGAERPLVVFGCDHGADMAGLRADDVCRFSLLCAGQLPPSFVEYALRDGAAGVLVLACRDGGCAFRFGERWTAERLAGVREPHLRAHVDASRVALAYAGRGDDAAAAQALAQLRVRVAALPRHESSEESHHA